MPLYLAGRSGSVAGRRLTVTRAKPFVIKTRTTNHEGEVQVLFSEGSYRLDNRSHMRCRLNGSDQRQAVLSHGDDLEIGKDRFAVEIEPDQASASTPDEHDQHDTQAVRPVSGEFEPATVPALQTCSVCDARLDAEAIARSWSDGTRRICARCLGKGVKPDHLPRPNLPASVPEAITPAGGAPIIADALTPAAGSALLEVESSTIDPRTASSPLLKAGVPDAASDSTAEVVPPRAATSDSDRQRHSRRISASRLTAVEPAQREGLLSRVGKVFGRRDERQTRLNDLESDRASLLAEAGRHALGPGGGLGLPEAAVATLLSGGSVTLSGADLVPTEVERWRALRQRMILLDAEIAALRKALGLGSDPQVHRSPPLRTDQKAMQDRAFATLDGLSTDELSRPDPTPQTEIAVRSGASGRLRPAPARRRR
jgi:hypothetical protein